MVKPGEPALKAVKEAFGTTVIQQNGSMDRAALRKIIFADPSAKKNLEAILHPRIRQRLLQQIEKAVAGGGAPYMVADIPLLVERNYTGTFDRIIVVDCSEAVQIDRVMARDGVSKTQVRKIMATQASREQRLSVATDIINNSGTLSDLHTQTQSVHEALISLV